MKRIATMLAAGALALFASLLVMVETADQANAFMRLGGFGGGMRSFGGGMRSFGGGMRSFGGGMRSFGGGMRSFGGGGGAMMRSNVSARHINATKHLNVAHTNTVSRVNVSKGSLVKQANIRNTPNSKHVSVAKTNTSKNITKTTTGKLADVRKPNIGKPVGTANLGATHVNAGNTKTNTNVNTDNKLGPSAINQGSAHGLAGGPAGPAGPGGIKQGPGALKPRLVGALQPPPGGFKPAPGRIGVINNRYVNIFRGPRQIWWAGTWVSLSALAVIPAVYVGGIDYEPYGYVALAEPVCSGVTPEGYRLTWRNVPTDTGATIPQCVAYYPRGRAAPAVVTGAVPGQTVGAAQPVMSAMAQGCLLEIYAEVAFTGMSSDVAADQPRLSEHGWDKQISSLDLKTGTWDFYSEPDYGGQVVRLPPGQYINLEGWDKRISSFMCIQVESRDWVKSNDAVAPVVNWDTERDWEGVRWR